MGKAIDKLKNIKLVKVLAKGELTSKLDVEAHAFSQKAEAIITEKGGNVVKL
jgi:large subunit ribosomal protein L15